MEPWKNVVLLPPPVLTTEISGQLDISGLRNTCDNIIRVLSKQSPLHKESALLSRFLYKYDKKFRHDIGYRNIKKTNTTLRKYLQVNLLKDAESFVAVLPNEDDNFAPARQMLEYLLLRTITFSTLMVRVYVCSKQGAVFYLNRVKRGENHWMSLMPYALLCRLWSISAVLIQHTISWYKFLHPYLKQLQPKGLDYLPNGYELPEELNSLLDLKNLDTFGKFHWTQHQAVDVEFSIPVNEQDTFDSILGYISQINDENLDEKLELKPDASGVKNYDVKVLPNTQKIDLGEAISRDSFNTITKQESTDKNNIKQPTVTSGVEILTNFQKKISDDNKSSHYFGKVTNEKSLKDFLNKEESYRNDGSQKSLTSHLSFMQWLTLKTLLLKACDCISNRKIERKLQKVWKDKCTDYL